MFGLTGVSARETDDNYLKNINPEARQLSKIFTLAVPYGANAGRIASIMKKPYEEAARIIDDYLEAYPKLKDYMDSQESEAKKLGRVKTRFGRVRHLPRAKFLYEKLKGKILSKKAMKDYHDEEGVTLYFEFRNYMNNAKNFPIQATAAHVTNAALIKLSKTFEEHKIDGWIALTIHDEITCIVSKKDAHRSAILLKDAMEHNSITDKIDVPMIAEPMIGNNFSETK